MFNESVFFSALLVLSNNLTDFKHNDTEEAPLADPDNVLCYGMFGCFPITPPWTSARRPIALYPQTNFAVQFPVFNYESRSYPKYLHIDDTETVHKTGINRNGTIFFITHGFLETGKAKWIEHMMNLLLNKDPNATVIVIDWGEGSNPPYNQACANIRLVGTIAAHIISMIMDELNLPDLDKVHMIGHSLGSHLSGYAGHTLQTKFSRKLGRITGLDPAELAFTETDELVRLDPSDAKFVDIVHSDATPFVPKIGLGLYEPIGHVDFYPNGGSEQPGCNHEFWTQRHHQFVSNMFQFFSCSHSRSYIYFTESITKPMMAVSCDSYEQYKAGKCFDCNAGDTRCIDFGLNSFEDYSRMVRMGKVNPQQYAPLQLFFDTNAHKPFLTQNFKVTVKISDSIQSTDHGPEIGKIFLNIYGPDDVKHRRVYFNKQPMLFEPGQYYSSVITGNSAGRPKSISIGWEYTTNLLNPLTWRILSSPRIYVDFVKIQSLGQHVLLTVCPTPNVPVTNNEPIVISETKCRHKQH